MKLKLYSPPLSNCKTFMNLLNDSSFKVKVIELNEGSLFWQEIDLAIMTMIVNLKIKL
jgi:hypothetical protein